MKKLVVLIVFLTFTLQSCNDEDVEFLPNQEISKSQVKTKALKSSSSSSSSCGDMVSGQHFGNGYYAYPDKTLDFSCIPNGTNITITFEAVEVPNRFRVIGAGIDTQWLGDNFPYQGPWGQNLLYGPHTKTITFQKSTDIYILKVETITQGTRLNDEWNIRINCAASCNPPCPNPNLDSDGDGIVDCYDDCPNVAGIPELNGCPGPDCTPTQGTIGDNYSGNGFHVYNETLDFCNKPIGSILKVFVSAADVPNRFFITDENGYTVNTPKWLGSSTQNGMWGQPFNGPSHQLITFIKVTETYNLRVETVVQGQQGQEDSWSATIY